MLLQHTVCFEWVNSTNTRRFNPAFRRTYIHVLHAYLRYRKEISKPLYSLSMITAITMYLLLWISSAAFLDNAGRLGDSYLVSEHAYEYHASA